MTESLCLWASSIQGVQWYNACGGIERRHMGGDNIRSSRFLTFPDLPPRSLYSAFSDTYTQRSATHIPNISFTHPPSIPNIDTSHSVATNHPIDQSATMAPPGFCAFEGCPQLASADYHFCWVCLTSMCPDHLFKGADDHLCPTFVRACTQSNPLIFQSNTADDKSKAIRRRIREAKVRGAHDLADTSSSTTSPISLSLTSSQPQPLCVRVFHLKSRCPPLSSIGTGRTRSAP